MVVLDWQNTTSSYTGVFYNDLRSSRNRCWRYKPLKSAEPQWPTRRKVINGMKNSNNVAWRLWSRFRYPTRLNERPCGLSDAAYIIVRGLVGLSEIVNCVPHEYLDASEHVSELGADKSAAGVRSVHVQPQRLAVAHQSDLLQVVERTDRRRAQRRTHLPYWHSPLYGQVGAHRWLTCR